MRSANVLIYCRNGQLGSAVVSSLAQIFLDPHFRTMKGFESLICKDWLYLEHDFIKYL